MSRPKEGATEPIGDDWEKLFPGEYLRGIDIEGHKPTVKIVRLYRKVIRGKKYPVAELEGKDRKWKINFTNGFFLSLILGPDPRKWIGHYVTLCTEVITAFGKTGPAIRVYGSPELKESIEAYKDLDDHGVIRWTLHPTKRNSGPPTSRSTGQ